MKPQGYIYSVEAIKSNKTFDSEKQLCAGFKIFPKKTPLFFEYSGLGYSMTFKEMANATGDWKPTDQNVRISFHMD